MSDPREPSSPEDIQGALTGGVPMGRWKEGLLFKGINPTPGLRSAANWFPRTEKLAPDEMRIIFMGTAPFIRPGQMNTSVFVQLGNGENFIFDIGEGSIANYIAGGFSLNELDKVFIMLTGWVDRTGMGQYSQDARGVQNGRYGIETQRPPNASGYALPPVRTASRVNRRSSLQIGRALPDRQRRRGFTGNVA